MPKSEIQNAGEVLSKVIGDNELTLFFDKGEFASMIETLQKMRPGDSIALGGGDGFYIVLAMKPDIH